MGSQQEGYREYGSESLISSCNTHPVLMLEVGYLHIDNPIAIISSHDRSDFSKSAGLLLLDGFDLDEVPLTEMQSCLDELKKNRFGSQWIRSIWPLRHLFGR